MIKHKNAYLFYKNIHGLTTPPLREFVNIRTNPSRNTRGVTRGDCIIPSRKSAFSQSAFSVTTSQEWNNIPTCIRDLNTYRSFSSNLKQWFIDNMTCQHWTWSPCCCLLVSVCLWFCPACLGRPCSLFLCAVFFLFCFVWLVFRHVVVFFFVFVFIQCCCMLSCRVHVLSALVGYCLFVTRMPLCNLSLFTFIWICLILTLVCPAYFMYFMPVNYWILTGYVVMINVLSESVVLILVNVLFF